MGPRNRYTVASNELYKGGSPPFCVISAREGVPVYTRVSNLKTNVCIHVCILELTSAYCKGIPNGIRLSVGLNEFDTHAAAREANQPCKHK